MLGSLSEFVRCRVGCAHHSATVCGGHCPPYICTTQTVELAANEAAHWPLKAPACGQCVGRFFDVGDLTPAAVVQVSVSEFVGDHVVRERLGTISQLGPEYHAPATAADRAGTGHPQRPSLAGNELLERDTKPGIVEKVALHQFRQTIQYDNHSLP